MTKDTKHEICALPLRDIVMFPGMVAPLFIGRQKSIKSLEVAVEADNKILLVTQKISAKEDPELSDVYEIGMIGNILQLLKLPDGTIKVLIEAKERVKVTNFGENTDFFIADFEPFVQKVSNEIELQALARSIKYEFEKYIKLNKKINPEIVNSINDINDPQNVGDIICSHVFLSIEKKQEILSAADLNQRLEKLLEYIKYEIGVLDTENRINNRVKKQMENTQKKYYLNEKLKAIHEELDENEDNSTGGLNPKSDLIELEEQINKMQLSEEAKIKALSELKKLKMMGPVSAEASIVRNYLDLLLGLPWGIKSKLKTNINDAKRILDKDHFGLEKIKERVLEFLAVQQRVKKIKGPILCFVGPPGVGKTSLARSIADATGRKFAKISLGGLKDESEIRGHRRTYIGAMPGKIIQSLKKVKHSNPVILLDEIDKIGADYRGDPASALLEVLDPEQNKSFADHYLEVEYDLSDVMFIATANSLNLPRPLLDRMEIIHLSGYTEHEKMEIAKQYLVQDVMKDHGLKKGEWEINDEAILEIIRYYTREAGVRNLDRMLAKLARKAVKEISESEGKLKQIKIDIKNLTKYLGVRQYLFGEAETKDQVGIVTGLAYTEVGGDLLLIETLILPGKGQIKATGKLGEVMQESAQAAFSYFKSRSADFGITPTMYQKRDIHVHVPEGATPKDGPSAGVAIFTSIVSAMSGIEIKKSVAMTGEITLRGRVLPIGGLKEKLLGALRGGITTVLIPKENVKDLEDIPDEIKKDLEIIPIEYAEEALKIALVRELEPVEYQEIDDIATTAEENNPDDLRTH